MTKILAIDTSGEACSVALSVGAEVLERFEVMPRLHARKLLPMVQSLLAESEVSLHALDAIAFGRGPGSFTGLRICAGVAQGLAFGADLPTLPVSSLAALAQGVYRSRQQKHIVTLLDARMGELYFACFGVEQGLVRAVDGQAEEQLLTPSQLDQKTAVLAASTDWLGVGDGWQFADLFPGFAQQLQFSTEVVHPRAMDIATLALHDFRSGRQLPAEQALPVYLRGKSAWRRLGE